MVQIMSEVGCGCVQSCLSLALDPRMIHVGVVAQVRAMQIIDELETRRRGPYGGGIGHVSFTGGMDMALALRTMVIPNPAPAAGTAKADANGTERAERQPRTNWTVHLQARCFRT